MVGSTISHYRVLRKLGGGWPALVWPVLTLYRATTGKARAVYEEFLTQWKDADPDLPILQQAKDEYAKLK